MATLNVNSLKGSLAKVRSFGEEGNPLKAKFDGTIQRAERQIAAVEAARVAARRKELVTVGLSLAQEIWAVAKTGDFEEAIRRVEGDDEGALSVYFISVTGRAVEDPANAPLGKDQVDRFRLFLDHAGRGIEVLQKFSAAIESEDPKAILDSLDLPHTFSRADKLPTSAQNCALAYAAVMSTEDVWKHELRAQACKTIAEIAGTAAQVLSTMKRAGIEKFVSPNPK